MVCNCQVGDEVISICTYLKRTKKTFKIFRRFLSTAKYIGMELSGVPLVDVDSSGVFKYILIKVYAAVTSDGKEPAITIVRGYKRASWHADIFDEVQSKLSPLDCECIGGGRIDHKPDEKKLHVYGYSQGYGRADHEITAQLLKEQYKDYTISISNEGY